MYLQLAEITVVGLREDLLLEDGDLLGEVEAHDLVLLAAIAVVDDHLWVVWRQRRAQSGWKKSQEQRIRQQNIKKEYDVTTEACLVGLSGRTNVPDKVIATNLGI